jgi:RHS repeat-associated protein
MGIFMCTRAMRVRLIACPDLGGMFFDNLQVTHVRGPLLEETHYYPFGLTMAGISGKASSFGQPGNKYKYNGIEFDEDLGINSYEAFYRELDPSTGRWWQIDPKIENQEMWSPYSSMSNDPVRYKDPLGDEPDGGTDGILSVAKTALGTISGLVVGTLDNLTGGQLRLAVSSNISDPQIANGWNKGLDGADAAAFLIGNGESGTGLAVATSSVYVTAGTGGATIVVSGPTALLGGALALHGQLVKANGLNNLGTQSGRVNTSTDNKTQSSGQTASGHPTDAHGNKLGPSGKPQVNTVNHSSMKKAKDAARAGGQGTPVKHTNPKKGGDHYHSTDNNGDKKPNSTHHEYPKS